MNKKKDRPIVVRIPSQEKREAFLKLAEEQGLSISSYVRKLIYDEVNRKAKAKN